MNDQTDWAFELTTAISKNCKSLTFFFLFFFPLVSCGLVNKILTDGVRRCFLFYMLNV